MKRLLFKFTLLMVVFWIILTLLAGLIFQSPEPPRNPFAGYSSYMPGASANSLHDCDYYYIYGVGFYASCDLSSGGVFTRVGMFGDNGHITQAWFYPVPQTLRLPELMALFGQWKTFHVAPEAVIEWPGNITVNIAEWHGMQSFITRIAFVGKDEGR